MQFVMNQWRIWRGGDEQLVVHMLDDLGNPLNLSGASALKLRITKQDGTILEKDASSGFAGGTNTIWIYVFPLSAAETALLPIGIVDVEIKIMLGTQVHVQPYKKSLTIQDPPIATTP